MTTAKATAKKCSWANDDGDGNHSTTKKEMPPITFTDDPLDGKAYIILPRTDIEDMDDDDIRNICPRCNWIHHIQLDDNSRPLIWCIQCNTRCFINLSGDCASEIFSEDMNFITDTDELSDILTPILNSPANLDNDDEMWGLESLIERDFSQYRLCQVTLLRFRRIIHPQLYYVISTRKLTPDELIVMCDETRNHEAAVKKAWKYSQPEYKEIHQNMRDDLKTFANDDQDERAKVMPQRLRYLGFECDSYDIERPSVPYTVPLRGPGDCWTIECEYELPNGSLEYGFMWY